MSRGILEIFWNESLQDMLIGYVSGGGESDTNRRPQFLDGGDFH